MTRLHFPSRADLTRSYSIYNLLHTNLSFIKTHEKDRNKMGRSSFCPHTYQHFGEPPLELDRVRHRLSRRAAYAAAACVRSAQAAHAQAGLTRVMRHAGLDTTDEYLANTAIVLAAAALHDSHTSVGFARARARASCFRAGMRFLGFSARCNRCCCCCNAARRDVT